MGQESRSRRKRAHARQDHAAPAPAPPSPEQLLAKYRPAPIADLPEPVQKFHLRVVTDILASHDATPKPLGPLRATGAWHHHHDGLAASRPRALNFAGSVKHLACAAGCNHCCRSPVGAVAAEVLLVADAVDRSFPAADRVALKQRMEARKAALQDGDRLQNYLCPLNVDGACTVYEARPYNCRVFHSFDVDACARRFLGDATQDGLPIDPVRRKYDRLITTSATVAFKALALDTRLLEFMAALEIALDAGPPRNDRLAAGDDLFASLPTIAAPPES